MNLHLRVVGILHIVFGALMLGAIAFFALFFGVFAALAPTQLHQWPFIPVIAGFSALVAAPAILFAIVELVSAILLLRGSASARAWVLAVGVLGALNFPLGTALGIYTLWALLRKAPVPSSLSVQAVTRA